MKLKQFRAQRKLQEAVWIYMVSQMSTKEETSELMKTFQALDANGDGLLSREELIQGYKQIMGEAQAISEVDALLAKLDTNNSGFIEYSEFVTGTMNSHNVLSQYKLENAFKIFDKDGSGQISLEEFKDIFATGNPNLSDKEWMNMIKEFDENGDGQISLEEFKKMMMNMQEALSPQQIKLDPIS